MEVTPAVERVLAEMRSLDARPPGSPIPLGALLRRLLSDRDSAVAIWCANQGLNLDQWSAQASADNPAEFPALSETELLLAARRFARLSTEDHVVSSEHLFLTILQRDETSRAALRDGGLRVDELEAEWHQRFTQPITLAENLELGDVVELMDATRVRDANANRAREALRVLEDHARFVLDDAILAKELKSLRHEFADCLDEPTPLAMATARNTLADVGTTISTVREMQRGSLHEIVLANWKRLQEALRSLEEFAKLETAWQAERFEAMRYRTYTLEKAFLIGSDARTRLRQARLYLLVSGASCQAALDWTIAEAASGGVDLVQLREKSLSDRELIERAREVRRWTRQAGVLFIVNDRPDIARLVEADGLHLGQDDLPVSEARRILGPKALIGVSTHHPEQLRKAILEGANYLGVGPTFPSATKPFDAFPGLDFVRQAAEATALPWFALGGISAKNIDAVLAAGARRVAVSAALTRAENPRREAGNLRRALDARPLDALAEKL